VLQLPQRLGLDLPDALARQRELLADFLQRVILVYGSISDRKCSSGLG
jgi:hypothetical protein